MNVFMGGSNVYLNVITSKKGIKWFERLITGQTDYKYSAYRIPGLYVLQEDDISWRYTFKDGYKPQVYGYKISTLKTTCEKLLGLVFINLDSGCAFFPQIFVGSVKKTKDGVIYFDPSLEYLIAKRLQSAKNINCMSNMTSLDFRKYQWDKEESNKICSCFESWVSQKIVEFFKCEENIKSTQKQLLVRWDILKLTMEDMKNNKSFTDFPTETFKYHWYKI